MPIAMSGWWYYYHSMWRGYDYNRSVVAISIIRTAMIITMTTVITNRNGFTMIRFMTAS
jgi:triphosphoribosyl-dephospho-CoA synthetase